MRLLIVLLTLTGCSMLPEKEVYIPTPISCVYWEPIRESDSFTKEQQSEPLWQQVKNLLLDREKDRRYIAGQEVVIKGCK